MVPSELAVARRGVMSTFLLRMVTDAARLGQYGRKNRRAWMNAREGTTGKFALVGIDWVARGNRPAGVQ